MNLRKNLIKGISYILTLAIIYYFWLPPLNYQALQFWIFLGFSVIYAAFLFIGGLKKEQRIFRIPNFERTFNVLLPNKKFLGIIVGVVVVALLLGIVNFVGSSQILHAHAYANLIEKKQNDFAADVKEISWNKIPTVDRDTAIRLGNRKMGEVVELVSQFTVSDEYTQINFQGNQVRVSPLQYASIIKWFTNQSKGIPYYMKVNMIDGKAELMKSEQPLRYTKSEYLNRNITRHLRFQYPFKLFFNSNFEVDDTGTPYWVTPVYKMRIGVFGAPDVKEVILTNVSTGESQLYPVKEVPSWVDVVYNANIIQQQIIWNGKYQNGFINSIIGQKGVLAPTKGYSYLAMNDDVYYYTGITSVSADQSNIGFILVNMRTKECNFYSAASAEEFSAMESAEGAVQEKKYKATFPLLINVNSRPTYFLSLKDEAGLIKMYAFIDAENYQNVVTGTSVAEAYKAFTLQQNAGVANHQGKTETTKVTGKITDIKPLVVEGNTVFYFTMAGEQSVYIAPLAISERLPFLKVGDTITIEAESGQTTRRVKMIGPQEGNNAAPEAKKDENQIKN